jgi:pilus assembly protein CpaB
MVKTTRVFKNFQQPQSVDLEDEVVGKAAYVPFYKGEQITLTKLVTQDGKPFLDKQVSTAMRAVTIAVSPFTGVGRLIRPGNRVDVLATPNYDFNGSLIYEVKTMFRNILVLATGKNLQNEVPARANRALLGALEGVFERDNRKDFHGTTENLATHRPDDSYNHVTLQFTPEDAEKILYLTQTFGDRALYLTLRSPADNSSDFVPSTILDDVLGPDSDYGRSKKKPLPIIPTKPRFIDLKGGDPEEVY